MRVWRAELTANDDVQYSSFGRKFAKMEVTQTITCILDL